MFLIGKRGERIDPSARIQVVAKAMHVLTAFTLQRPHWGVTELARHLGYPKSLVSKVLNTLIPWGLVEQEPSSRRYRLGPRVLSLAYVVGQNSDLRQLGLPALRQLVERTGETAKLSVVDGDESLVVERVESPHSMRMTATVGQRNPLYAGASNLLLLAHRPPEEAERILRETAPPDHLWRIDPDPFRARLATMRQEGYACSMSEVEVGVLAVAAPARNHTGQVVATVSINGPAQRIPETEYPRLIRDVTEAAAKVSAGLGAL